MAAALADIAALAEDPAFQSRVKAAMMRTAVDVIRKAQEEQQVTERDKRIRDVAVAAIEAMDAHTATFAWLLASIPAITAASADTELIPATRAAWGYLARLPI